MKFTLEIDLASRAMQTNGDIAERLRNLAAIIRSQGFGKHSRTSSSIRPINYISAAAKTGQKRAHHDCMEPHDRHRHRPKH